jgi:co-chaperonin GroES (HSP10)
MRGGIFVPEIYNDASTSCKVLAKGERVTSFIKVDETVLCQVGFGDRKTNTVDGTRAFWCREHNVYGVIKNNIIFPIGRKVLIKRDIEDKYVGQVVIPSNRRTQSLDGIIHRLGLTREVYKTMGLELGMSIRLKEWMEHMIEVTLEDGSYGIIVNESDLLFAYE